MFFHALMLCHCNLVSPHARREGQSCSLVKECNNEAFVFITEWYYITYSCSGNLRLRCMHTCTTDTM